MTRVGDTVTVHGEQYRVTEARHAGHAGSKFFGKFVFILANCKTGEKMRAFGKSVSHNSRLIPERTN